MIEESQCSDLLKERQVWKPKMARTASSISSLLGLPSPLFLKPPRRLPFKPLKPLSPLPRSPPSSSYNGWADLASSSSSSSSPGLPFSLPLLELSWHGFLPLLFLLLSLSRLRLPPLPLLAAGFIAGFAARHLSPFSSLSHSQPQRLAAVLADLDAKAGVLKDQLSRGSDMGALLEALDLVRSGIGDASRLAGDGKNIAPEALQSVVLPLGDVVKEIGDNLGGFAREAVRELRSPRKKAKEKVAAVCLESAVDDKNSDVGVVAKGKKDQQDDGKKLLDSSADLKTQMTPVGGSSSHGVGENKFVDSKDGRRRVGALDMLPFDDDVYGLEDAGLTVASNGGRSDRPVFKYNYSHSGMRNDLVDPSEGDGLVRESMESSLLERTLEIRDRSYRLKIGRREGKSKVSDTEVRSEDEFVGGATTLDPVIHDRDKDLDGEEFSRNIKDAAEILRKAREFMMARTDEETADALLYKSARLLSTAVALKPTSLVAVGQLGNTYLLHGELKLKISRELRMLLGNSKVFLGGREHGSQFKKLDRRILSRESISSALVDVCEECESLLVEAGRSYRMALSIDSGDVKALYNWGLALIFRGQLLADIGPEAALDADNVYLAAIDKFDAMLSKSNTYAPEALYRWGTALQQRSHLCSRNNKEKIRLLEQAKSMYEDVLYVEADNKLVREALSSCISELNYHGRWL